MQKLNNQNDAIIRTGTIAIEGYTGHVRYDREGGKMPQQITVSINHTATDNKLFPLRLNVSINTGTGKTSLNSQDISDISTGLKLAAAVNTWLKAYATDLKTEIEGGAK